MLDSDRGHGKMEAGKRGAVGLFSEKLFEHLWLQVTFLHTVGHVCYPLGS